MADASRDAPAGFALPIPGMHYGMHYGIPQCICFKALSRLITPWVILIEWNLNLNNNICILKIILKTQQSLSHTFQLHTATRGKPTARCEFLVWFPGWYQWGREIGGLVLTDHVLMHHSSLYCMLSMHYLVVSIITCRRLYEVTVQYGEVLQKQIRFNYGEQKQQQTKGINFKFVEISPPWTVPETS